MHLHFGVAGCEIASMLPNHGSIMWRVVQDVISAEPIRLMRANLLSQMEGAQEFETLGIDCSVKVSNDDRVALTITHEKLLDNCSEPYLD